MRSVHLLNCWGMAEDSQERCRRNGGSTDSAVSNQATFNASNFVIFAITKGEYRIALESIRNEFEIYYCTAAKDYSVAPEGSERPVGLLAGAGFPTEENFLHQRTNMRSWDPQEMFAKGRWPQYRCARKPKNK